MECRLIHGHLLTNGLHSNAYLNTNLVIFYSKLGDMVNSRNVFDRMSERSLVTWTALVSGYSQNGYLEEALVVFSAMYKIGVKSALADLQSKCGKMEDVCYIFESMSKRFVVSWNAMADFPDCTIFKILVPL
ncbi:hypothetical protein ACSBR2_010907 [Camellia fascicularis]